MKDESKDTLNEEVEDEVEDNYFDKFMPSICRDEKRKLHGKYDKDQESPWKRLDRETREHQHNRIKYGE